MKRVTTIPGKTYAVTCRNACTVGVADMPDYILLELENNKQGFFVAISNEVYITADDAKLTEVFKLAPVAGGGGGAAVIKPATGEPVLPMTTTEFTMKHATWFENAEQSSITVNPAPWKNEVMTCYLKTAVPVALSGVNWIYGAPVMVEAYTYVIALQQVDAATVLANLAYTIPQ